MDFPEVKVGFCIRHEIHRPDNIVFIFPFLPPRDATSSGRGIFFWGVGWGKGLK